MNIDILELVVDYQCIYVYYVLGEPSLDLCWKTYIPSYIVTISYPEMRERLLEL